MANIVSGVEVPCIIHYTIVYLEFDTITLVLFQAKPQILNPTLKP